MKTGYVLAAVAAAMLAGSTAFAAATTPAAKCTALEKQWDQVITQHANAPKVATARTLHDEGVKMCTAGKAADGVKKLEQALNDIGVKPQY